MVVLSKIYTKTGDKGETALGNGSRVPKYALRVEAYGGSDETNATIGLARQHATGDMDVALSRIQNDLFDLGADLCRPDRKKDTESEYPPLRMTAAQTERLEAEIDAMNERLEPLRSFGRAERVMVELATVEDVNPHALRYTNRLSDWLFVASRIANDDGKADVLWVPGANR